MYIYAHVTCHDDDDDYYYYHHYYCMYMYPRERHTMRGASV